MSINIEPRILGSDKKDPKSLYIECSKCKGTGGSYPIDPIDGTDWHECKACNGAGEVIIKGN